MLSSLAAQVFLIICPYCKSEIKVDGLSASELTLEKDIRHAELEIAALEQSIRQHTYLSNHLLKSCEWISVDKQSL